MAMDAYEAEFAEVCMSPVSKKLGYVEEELKKRGFNLYEI